MMDLNSVTSVLRREIEEVDAFGCCCCYRTTQTRRIFCLRSHCMEMLTEIRSRRFIKSKVKLTDGDSADVGLKLHKQIIFCHFSITMKLCQMKSRIFFHSFNYVSDLITYRLECSSHDVILCRECSQTTNYSRNQESWESKVVRFIGIFIHSNAIIVM